MQRVARVDGEQNPNIDDLYTEIVSSGFGGNRPINFFTALSARPDILDATWKLTRAILVGGQLPASIKQMIALCISRQNDCRYCVVVHRGALEAAGVDPHIVESCATDPSTTDLKEPHRSMIQFAMKAARDPAAMTDADYAAMHDAGLSSEEIAELVMLAGFTNFINAWADISGIPVDGAI